MQYLYMDGGRVYHLRCAVLVHIDLGPLYKAFISNILDDDSALGMHNGQSKVFHRIR